MTRSKPLFLVSTTLCPNSNIPEISKLYSTAHFQDSLIALTEHDSQEIHSYVFLAYHVPCTLHWTQCKLDVLL